MRSHAIESLESRRASYPETGNYPFLIGDARELERIGEAEEFSNQSFDDIIRIVLDIDVSQWIAERRAEDEFVEETLGTWPSESAAKGTVSIHQKVLSGKITPED